MPRKPRRESPVLRLRCWGPPQGGGNMKNRKILTGLALGAVLVMVAAACGGKAKTTSSGGTDKCRADKFGCVIIGAGNPINFGAIASVSGSTAALGTDSDNGVKLAMDYLDSNFDGRSGPLAGHPVQPTVGGESDP